MIPIFTAPRTSSSVERPRRETVEREDAKETGKKTVFLRDMAAGVRRRVTSGADAFSGMIMRSARIKSPGGADL